MDFSNRFFNYILKPIQQFKIVKDKRIKQLHVEEEIDKEIIKKFNTCPNKCLELLLKLREMNRKMVYETSDVSIFDLPNKSLQNMKKFDIIFEDVLNNGICSVEL